MKKFGIFALAVILALSAAGCGKRDNKNPTTTPSTAPATTAPTVMPEIPEIETNIPDPTVNDNSTGDSTDMTGTTDATDSTDMTQGSSRSSNRFHGQ